MEASKGFRGPIMNTLQEDLELRHSTRQLMIAAHWSGTPQELLDIEWLRKLQAIVVTVGKQLVHYAHRAVSYRGLVRCWRSGRIGKNKWNGQTQICREPPERGERNISRLNKRKPVGYKWAEPTGTQTSPCGSGDGSPVAATPATSTSAPCPELARDCGGK